MPVAAYGVAELLAHVHPGRPRRASAPIREDIRLALEQLDIESRPTWKPLHLQPVFADAPRRRGRGGGGRSSTGGCACRAGQTCRAAISNAWRVPSAPWPADHATTGGRGAGPPPSRSGAVSRQRAAISVATSPMDSDRIPWASAKEANSSSTRRRRSKLSWGWGAKLWGCHHRWKMRARRARVTEPGHEPRHAQRLEGPPTRRVGAQERAGRDVAQPVGFDDLLPGRGGRGRTPAYVSARRATRRSGLVSRGGWPGWPREGWGPRYTRSRCREPPWRRPGSTGCAATPGSTAAGRPWRRWPGRRPDRRARAPSSWPASRQ